MDLFYICFLLFFSAASRTSTRWSCTRGCSSGRWLHSAGPTRSRSIPSPHISCSPCVCVSLSLLTARMPSRPIPLVYGHTTPKGPNPGQSLSLSPSLSLSGMPSLSLSFLLSLSCSFSLSLCPFPSLSLSLSCSFSPYLFLCIYQLQSTRSAVVLRQLIFLLSLLSRSLSMRVNTTGSIRSLLTPRLASAGCSRTRSRSRLPGGAAGRCRRCWVTLAADVTALWLSCDCAVAALWPRCGRAVTAVAAVAVP